MKEPQRKSADVNGKAATGKSWEWSSSGYGSERRGTEKRWKCTHEIGPDMEWKGDGMN